MKPKDFKQCMIIGGPSVGKSMYLCHLAANHKFEVNNVACDNVEKSITGFTELNIDTPKLTKMNRKQRRSKKGKS